MSMFSELKLVEEFKIHASRNTVSEGDVLMQPGHYIKAIPILLSGCLRVIRHDTDGNEVFLYHISPGETCALSLNCCSTQKPSVVKVVAEDDSDMWMIPIGVIESWQQYKEWREFIALTYQNRFNALLHVIDDIAFKKLDERLWQYLLARAKAQDTHVLHVSHEEIAQELNIQREAATRIIRKLKDLGRVETGRNQIILLETE